MKKYIWLIALVPVVVFANEAAGANEGTDFFPRLVNFLIFAGIIYYLLADKTKEFFTGRQAKIASRFEEIQAKLKESIKEKELAAEKVEEAKRSAQVIIDTAKKEIESVKKKAAEDLERELKNLEKNYQDKVEVEKRRVAREVAEEVIEEIFENEDDILKKDDLVEIINKKVA